MAIAQIDQFTQALTGTMVQVIVVCAILVAVVGLPLYWFRLKVERALICAIRSARARRQTGKSAASANESVATPHCPDCSALMMKRVARHGSGAGSTFWGCSNYPKCRGARAI